MLTFLNDSLGRPPGADDWGISTCTTPTRPMTQAELDTICEAWDLVGSHDSTDNRMDLWDGGDADEHPDTRDEIIAIARDCGLATEVVDGILRLPLTKQLDDEIGENWV